MNIIGVIIKKFKKKEIVKEKPITRKSLVNTKIYCRIKWNMKENKLWFYRHNDLVDVSDKSELISFPRNPVPSTKLFMPVIIHYTAWRKLLDRDFNLKEYTIEFSNFMSDVNIYSVLMIAVNKKNKEIIDSFTSTKSEYVDPRELLTNIITFLEFAGKK